MNEYSDSKSGNNRSGDRVPRYNEPNLDDSGEREPSVLDYFKSVLTPWRGKPIPFPTIEGESQSPLASQKEIPDTQVTVAIEFAKKSEIDQTLVEEDAWQTVFPWRTGLGLTFALIAQLAFAPPGRSAEFGISFMIGAAILLIWGFRVSELKITPLPKSMSQIDDRKVRVPSLVIGSLLAAVSFWLSLVDIPFLSISRGQFNLFTLTMLGIALAFFLHAFWQGRPSFVSQFSQTKLWISDSEKKRQLIQWSLVLLTAIVIVLFFRTYQLESVPPEMVSDHAEKYLDVNDILNGNPRIFFPRNGGREALQFYLLATMRRFFDLPPTFLTLKISSVIIGLLALPYIYLLGSEVGNRRVGLIAFTFAGVAYWTNVVARAGMRLPFYMLFTAAVLFHLLRGIRLSERNHFILAGIFLGLGFYGYSADRLLPLSVVVGIALYLLHRQSQGLRRQTIWHMLLMTFMALIVFLPLLSYIIYDPSGFSGRMISRMSGTEQPLQGPLLSIFLDNLWHALAMFSWSNGVVWGVSIPDYPALGIISGGFFYIGIIIVLIRYVRKRNWLDIFLILAIPPLMLPSVLSVAFPAENPNLYRTGGAMVPVFLLVGIALDSTMITIENASKGKWGPRLSWALLAVFVLWSSVQNYGLVFDKYRQNYLISAWNYSEMGHVIKSFSQSSGNPDSAWVMAYPHWADTRLVAIEAGYPERNFAMFIDDLHNTQQHQGPKLFLVHKDDQSSVDALIQYYPAGWIQTFESEVPGKDFLMFFTPPGE